MKNKKSTLDFSKIAKSICNVLGNFWSFVIAFLLVIIWLGSGPIFHYSDTWQLIINTSTTIITFLMVFIIQNTQNRDTEILELKVDEVIKAMKNADNNTLDLDDLTEEQLESLLKKYKKLKNSHTGK